MTSDSTSSPRKARATELNADSVKSERTRHSDGQFEPLSQKFPQLASQWHASNNGQWSAHDFSSGSDVIAWWQCESGPDHVWQAPIFSRAAGKGCPFAPTKESRSLILWLSFFHKWRKNGTLLSMMAAVPLSSLADQRKKSGGCVAIIASINGRPKFLDGLTAVVAPIALIRKPAKKIAWLLNFPISLLNCTQLRMVLLVVNR